MQNEGKFHFNMRNKIMCAWTHANGEEREWAGPLIISDTLCKFVIKIKYEHLKNY